MNENSRQTRKDIGVNEYNSIHVWIRYRYGSATKCSNKDCQSKSKRFEWALREGFKYERNIENYIQLCKPCHSKYDKYPEFRKGRKFGPMSAKGKKNLSDAHKGKPVPWRYSKILASTDKIEWKEFESMTLAAKILGTTHVGICAVLRGRNRTSGGYYFKRP